MSKPTLDSIATAKAQLEKELRKLEEQEALELIAQALAVVVNEMVVGGRPFNPEKYRTLLKDLPLLPDESP